MSHEININEETGKANVFVVKEPAWHGLGTVVQEAVTAEEAIQLAGLDFDVIKQPVLYEVNGEVREVPHNHAIVRSDNSDVLGVVGDVYTPLQNREAFKFFDALVSEKEAI